MPAPIVGLVVGAAARAVGKKVISQAAKKGAKGITAGMSKAPGKVQKGLDKTENRIPGKPKMVTGLSDGKVYADTKNSSTRIKGSNKAAAKGNVPKRTPGVKKNTSLQRSINNSNKNLKK
jgi:hypothetical protein